MYIHEIYFCAVQTTKKLDSHLKYIKTGILVIMVQIYNYELTSALGLLIDILDTVQLLLL